MENNEDRPLKSMYRMALDNAANMKEGPDFPVEEKLKQADSIKPSMMTSIEDVRDDLIGGAVLGAISGKVIGSLLGKARALKELTSNESKILGEPVSSFITDKSKKQTGKLIEAMEDNIDTAIKLQKGNIKPKKAQKKIINNFELESTIGPDWAADIETIINNNTKLSKKEIKKRVNNWLKKNGDNPSLLKLIEAKEPRTTFGHSIRVAEITKQLALENGMSLTEAENLAKAALLHDIGKIAVFDRVTNSKDFFAQTGSKRNLDMENHDVTGSEILKEFNDFAARIAKYHHPKHMGNNGKVDENLVTTADIYDAISSPRSYKTGKSKDVTIDIMQKDSVNNKHEITQEYLDLLKRLDEKGLLKEYYPVESELADAYDSMRANGLFDYIKKEYGRQGAIVGGLFGADAGLLTAGLNADKGGVLPSQIPSLSEIKRGIAPWTRDKKELLEEIKQWYVNGLISKENEKLIIDTDFNNKYDVRNLWLKLNKEFSHE